MKHRTYSCFNLLTFSLLLFPCYVLAQWPPVPATPSPVSKNFHLPGSRFVPSTKRWNLVWADQIIPGNFSPTQIKFAAEHYAATQKIFADQAAQFRATNPNFLVVEYHLAAGLNPLQNSNCPDPKTNTNSFIGVVTPFGYVSEYLEYFRAWLGTNGITEGDARYEGMFQHYDQLDSLHRVWHQDPAWLMDLANTDWQKYLGDVTLDWMNGASDDGCFFDVAVETNSSLYNPKSGDPAPVDFEWWAPPHGPAGEASQTQDRPAFSKWMNKRFLGCYQNIYKRFHTASEDFLVIPNTDQMVTTVYDPLWTDGDANGETIDGAMMESFGSYKGQDMWQTLERGLRHITGRGKILIAQFYGVDSVERLRRTAMYMLIKNENSFLNIINANGVEWYPEYEIDLGDQSPLPKSLDSLRVAGQDWHSVWARDYTRGRVLCNTSDMAIHVVLPTGGKLSQVLTGGGGKVNNDGSLPPQHISYIPVSGIMTIPASGCVILSRQDTTSSVTIFPRSKSIVLINPNPAYGTASIHISNADRVSMSISIDNFLGSEVAQIFSGELESGGHSFRWDAHSMPAGIYTCIVRTNSGVQAEKIVLLH